MLGSGVVSPGLGCVRASAGLVKVAVAEQLTYGGKTNRRFSNESAVLHQIGRTSRLERGEEHLSFRMSLEVPNFFKFMK